MTSTQSDFIRNKPERMNELSDECLEDSLKHFENILATFALNAVAIIRQTNQELRQVNDKLAQRLKQIETKSSVCAHCKGETKGEGMCRPCLDKLYEI